MNKYRLIHVVLVHYSSNTCNKSLKYKTSTSICAWAILVPYITITLFLWLNRFPLHHYSESSHFVLSKFPVSKLLYIALYSKSTAQPLHATSAFLQQPQWVCAFFQYKMNLSGWTLETTKAKWFLFVLYLILKMVFYTSMFLWFQVARQFVMLELFI